MMVEGQSDNEIEVVDPPVTERARPRRGTSAVGIEDMAAQQKQRRTGERVSKPPQFSTRRSRSPDEHSAQSRSDRRGSSVRTSASISAKKDKPGKAKGNESPFNIAGPSRPRRGTSKKVSYSSPVKRSDDHDDQQPNAATEPRRRTLDTQPQRHNGEPSSPTSAPQRRRELGDENALPSNARSQMDFTRPRNAEASSSRIRPTACPSGGGHSLDLIHIGDSDDGVDNDENRPPRPQFNTSKQFRSTVSIGATGPATPKGNAVASSSRGTAREQQPNGHRPDREHHPSWPSHDASSQEEIEQFSSLDSRLTPPKAKEKEKALPEPHAPRARKQMQDKNGNTPMQKNLTRRSQSKPVSKTQQIPSSKLRRHVLKCIDDNFVLDLSLDRQGLKQLEPLLDDFGLSKSATEASGTAYTDIRVLFVMEDDQEPRRFLTAMAEAAPGLEHTIENKLRSGIDFLHHGDSDMRQTKETPAQSSPMVKAADAAMRRQGVLSTGRPKPVGAVVKTTAQMDSRQTTLKLQGTRKSSRLANSDRPTNRYNESSPTPEQDGAVVSVPPPVDKKEFLFHLHGLDITAGERHRLASNDFLNDTFLEFGLRYVLDQLRPETRDEVHCFNSFFYSKLSDKSSRKSAPSDVSWAGYDAVKRWTRKVDVFSKKFILVPVNESYHWYLAVIYNPRAALDFARASMPSLTDALRDDLESRRSSTSAGGVASGDNRESVTRDASRSSGACTPDGGRPVPTHNEYSSDTDPLNIIDQPDDEPEGKEERDVGDVRAGVNKLQLEAAVPQPIQSATFDLFTEQSLGDMGTGANAKESTSRVSSPPPAKKGRKPHRPDYDILGTHETWIFTLDSMGNSRHPSVGKDLMRWLRFEARDKLNEDVDSATVHYFEGKCLDQPNFFDCGLYLIHFAKQLLLKSDDVLRFIGGAPRPAGIEGHVEWELKKNEVWAAHEPSTLRRDWIEIIDVQTQTYRSLNDTATTGQAVQDPGPPASQLSVQALSQVPPPPEAHAPSVAPTQTLDPETSAGHTGSSTLASTSVYTRLPAPLSPSPVREESEVAAHGDSFRDPSSSAGILCVGAQDKPDDEPVPRPPVSHCISNSDEEEEEIEERQGGDGLEGHGRASPKNDEDDESKHEEIGRETQAATDIVKFHDRFKQADEEPPNQLHDCDGGDGDDLCRRAIIDPNMQSPTRDGTPSMWPGWASNLPVAYPDEEMDVDQARGSEIDPSTTPASRTILSPSAIDPFADLGTSEPIHRLSGGGGRADPRRSSTVCAERGTTSQPHPSEAEVLVAASSSQSKSPPSGAHDSGSSLAAVSASQLGETPTYNPYRMNYRPPDQPAPSADVISVDDDSPDDSRAGPATSRRQNTERRDSQRALRLQEVSNDSPGPHRPTTRRANRRLVPASSDEEVRARSNPPRGASQRRASTAHDVILKSGDGVLGDSEGSDHEPVPARAAKPRSKPTPTVKANGKAIEAQPEMRGSAASPVVVTDEDCEDGEPAAGPSDRPEREVSLEPMRPKRRPTKTYAHGAVGKNKRRKTVQGETGQQKILSFWAPNEAGIQSEKRGRSAEDPYLLDDE
ncbi:hypothetical protein CcaverHIS631_0110730 [Cutaneotrichosporon cavernicola]|nr:hypothetical protein CcaverHIS631_0110730 [Cutaneotrichosporon cavernicola]